MVRFVQLGNFDCLEHRKGLYCRVLWTLFWRALPHNNSVLPPNKFWREIKTNLGWPMLFCSCLWSSESWRPLFDLGICLQSPSQHWRQLYAGSSGSTSNHPSLCNSFSRCQVSRLNELKNKTAYTRCRRKKVWVTYSVSLNWYKPERA